MNNSETQRNAHPRRQVIAVIGDASITEDCESYVQARRLGTALVDAGFRILTGGLGGVMEAACRGARESSAYREGDIIGVLPGFDPAEANPWTDIAVPTGLDTARNVIVAQADAVIAIGGGAGTLCEMALAWIFKRLLIAFRGPGWAGKLADQLIDERVRYQAVVDDRVYGVDDAAGAIAMLRAKLPFYTDRHHGTRRQ